MDQNQWGSFDYWQALYDGKSRSLEGCFSSNTLTDSSIFIWFEISPPKRSDALNGKWDQYPEPKALAGFLRYVGLSAFFDIWLVREEWDNAPRRFRHPDYLLTMAENSDACRFKEKIPNMQEIYAELDELFDLPDDEVRKGLKQIASDFNEHWSHTNSWHFRIQILNSPMDVGEEIFSRQKKAETPFCFSKRDWLDLCGNVLDDPESQKQFLQVMDDNALF